MVDFSGISTLSRAILCQEVRESRLLYAHIYVFLQSFLERFLQSPIIYEYSLGGSI